MAVTTVKQKSCPGVTCSPGEKCLKYLWNFHLTAKDAKMVLLTRADLRSVRAPGEC